MGDYLRGRALEWSTLRGLIWLVAGLLGIDLTDAQVTDLIEAAELAANIGADPDVQARLWGKVAAFASAVVGFLGMATPDGRTSAGWDFLGRLFGKAT